MRSNVITIIALLLVVIGALNWALIGIFEFDLVAELFGEMSDLTRVVYTVVGAAGLYTLGYVAHLLFPNVHPISRRTHIEQH